MPGPADADARAGVNLQILSRGGACRQQQSGNAATLGMAILRRCLLADLGSRHHIITKKSFQVKTQKVEPKASSGRSAMTKNSVCGAALFGDARLVAT